MSNSSDGDSPEQQQQQQQQQLLPLGWTRVVRPRKRPAPVPSSSSLSGDGHDDDGASAELFVCCQDNQCLRRQRQRHTASKVPDIQNQQQEETAVTSDAVDALTGNAIFLLHDVDPSWFQGYFFFPTTTGGHRKKPLGLLATQTAVDECLACADGGYRVLDIAVHDYQDTMPSPKTVITDVEWTGGDMMALASPLLQFAPDKLVMGQAAVPLVQTVFGSLLRQLDIEPVLDSWPDVAVVGGTMTLHMLPPPPSSSGSSTTAHRPAAGSSNDFLE